MSKRRYIIVILLLFLLYNIFVWQHLVTQRVIEQIKEIRLYYAIGLVLFLATAFFTYLMEKNHHSSRIATVIYILLLITGAPFLYKLILHLILLHMPFLFQT